MRDPYGYDFERTFQKKRLLEGRERASIFLSNVISNLDFRPRHATKPFIHKTLENLSRLYSSPGLAEDVFYKTGG